MNPRYKIGAKVWKFNGSSLDPKVESHKITGVCSSYKKSGNEYIHKQFIYYLDCKEAPRDRDWLPEGCLFKTKSEALQYLNLNS